MTVRQFVLHPIESMRSEESPDYERIRHEMIEKGSSEFEIRWRTENAAFWWNQQNGLLPGIRRAVDVIRARGEDTNGTNN